MKALTILWESKPLALTLSAVLLVFGFVLFVVDAHQTILLDFEVYLEAAQRLVSKKNIYDYTYLKEVENGQVFKQYYFYPPLLALLLTPIAGLDLEHACLVWCCILFAALLLSSLVICKLTDLSTLRRYDAWQKLPIILFFLLCFEPVYWSVREGQVAILLLLFLSLWVLYHASDKPWRAGFFLALASWIKMTPVMLLLIPIKYRDLKSILSFLLTSLLIAATIFFYTHDLFIFRDFLAKLPELNAGQLMPNFPYNFALERVLLEPLSLRQSELITWTLKLGLLTLPLFITLRTNTGASSRLYLHAALIACMLVISPVLWFHHLVWLLIPLSILAMAISNSDGTSHTDKIKSTTGLVALYFFLSQSNLYFTLARKFDPLLATILRLLPATLILIMIYVLFRKHLIKDG